ncbi:MAG: methenyltetrahydromethanopterin cyclohydrolase [Gemmataceae bacterium]|nr:methenyltetrahydromethanopterin cyclohydrolase [Gemmataceae bacterium]
MTLNERAARVAERMKASPGVSTTTVGGATVLDCREGGVQAGLELARLCLGGLGEVSLHDGCVYVESGDPVRACLASQYAGWQVSVGRYFAMGSGPMRAAYGKEKLFDHIGCRESPPVAVGALETRKPPTEEVIAYLCERVKLPGDKLTLACAPAASLPGTVQVVARSLETALHKLHALGFDLSRVVTGEGDAPLPPVAPDEGTAIGWTNDAILYGGTIEVRVTGDDDTLSAIVGKVPSSSSPDHGRPFKELLAAAGGDFYRIDPHLFSPAVIRLVNTDTGRHHYAGRLEPEVLRRSFGG